MRQTNRPGERIPHGRLVSMCQAGRCWIIGEKLCVREEPDRLRERVPATVNAHSSSSPLGSRNGSNPGIGRGRCCSQAANKQFAAISRGTGAWMERNPGRRDSSLGGSLPLPARDAEPND